MLERCTSRREYHTHTGTCFELAAEGDWVGEDEAVLDAMFLVASVAVHQTQKHIPQHTRAIATTCKTHSTTRMLDGDVVT